MMNVDRQESNNPQPIPILATLHPSQPGKGFQIGEYRIVDLLGHGSMANVYLALDRTNHEVALKLFQEGPGVSATMLERFRREADASKKLRRHPHIMKIYATGQEGPYHFIVMECIKRSKTLENALEGSSLSLGAIVLIIIRIARALQYAHAHRIIHRDVKPTNIMIDEFGEPLLSDFGVAELVDLPSCTVTGALTGTPLYMSPEQARGERVGPESDIYSLGVVLYEALTGVLPYTTQHYAPVKQVIEAVKNEIPRRPRLFRKEISQELEAVILKALEKDPKERYVDAEAFAVDMERAMAGKPVSAHHFSVLDRVRHLARRYRHMLASLGVLMVAGLGITFFFRNQLLNERYDNLLRIAQLKNMEYLLELSREKSEASGQTPQAWSEIRLARRHMTSGDWAAAANSFQNAADLSRATRDGRTAAIALLEQARCEAMLDQRAKARDIYRRVLVNPDASPTVAESALVEYLWMALLDGDRFGAVQILKTKPLPEDRVVRAVVDCLGGEGSPDALLTMIPQMPQRYQNDAYLSLAVRHFADGEVRPFHWSLKQSVESSAPVSEWPSTLARQLHGTVLR
ncbi:MAG: protein kinase [Lentisphaerota bacterium]